MMQKIVFGTDGWRGLLDKELNLENIRRVAQAFAIYTLRKTKNGKVVLGFDGRQNSEFFAMEFSKVLIGNGISAFLSNGISPTPLLSFYTRENDCDAGVMVTASHNPPEYNGLKFKKSDGAPFSTEETAVIEGLIDSEAVLISGREPQKVDLFGSYQRHLEQTFDFRKISASGLNVLVDSMNGAGADLIEKICTNHKITCESIFSKPENDFGDRIPEPIEKNLLSLSNELKKGDHSIGFATDGDADRIGIMDDLGQWVSIQEAILYLADYMIKKYGPYGGVVKTSSVTDKLRSLFSGSRPVKVHDVQVGFKFVSEAMVKHNAVFGAEESGGFGFFNHLPDRDGIFSALMFLQMLAESGEKKLSGFLEKKRREFGEVFYDRVDLKTSSPRRHLVLPFLEKMPPDSIAGTRVVELQSFKSSRGIINGLKFRLQGNPRWLLIRVSETEPIARIYAEAEMIEDVRLLLAEGQQLFE